MLRSPLDAHEDQGALDNLGLHPSNDPWNGTLEVFYEGRYYNPPHVDLAEFRRVWPCRGNALGWGFLQLPRRPALWCRLLGLF